MNDLVEKNIALDVNKLIQIKEIFETSDRLKANLYLDWGWKIVAITSGVIGGCEGYILYSLAWFGESKPETPDPWKKSPSENA